MKQNRNAVFAIMLMAATVQAEDKVFWALVTGTEVATAYDLQTTRNLLQRCASCYEGNPIMRPFVGSLPAAYGTALSFNVASVYGSLQLKKKGSRWWWVPLAAPIVAHTVAGVSNKRLQ